MKKIKLIIALTMIFGLNYTYSAQFNEQNDSLLSILIKNGDYNLAQTLMNLSLDVNQQNSKGETPILEAVRANQAELVNTLLFFGANINLYQALKIAKQNNNQQVIDILEKEKPHSFNLTKAITGQGYNSVDLFRGEQVKNIGKIKNLIYDIQNAGALFLDDRQILTQEQSDCFNKEQHKMLFSTPVNYLKDNVLEEYDESQIQIFNNVDIYLKWFDLNFGIDNINKQLSQYIVNIISSKFNKDYILLLEIALENNLYGIYKIIFKSELIDRENIAINFHVLFVYFYTQQNWKPLILLINYGVDLNLFIESSNNTEPFLSTLTKYKTPQARFFKNLILDSILNLHKSNPGLININSLDLNRKTALITAIEHNNIYAARALINSGININIIDNDLNSALSYALDKQCLDLIELLIKSRAIVNNRDIEIMGDYIDDLTQSIITLLNVKIINSSFKIEQIIKLIDEAPETYEHKSILLDKKKALIYLVKLRSTF